MTGSRSHAENEYRRGRKLESEGRWAEAVEAFARAVTVAPHHVDAHYDLARSLDRVGRSDEAIEAYARLLEIAPDFAQAHTELGVILGERGLWNEAAAAHQRATELEPTDAGAFYNLGVALRANGRVEAAAAAYEEAIRLKPDLWEAYDNLAESLGSLRRWDEAIGWLDRAIEGRPRDGKAATSFLNRSIALRARGDLGAALEAARTALDLAKDSGEAHAMEGTILTDLGQWTEAIPSLARGLSLKGSSASASDHFNLAIALSRVGRIDEAKLELMEALSVNPHDVEALELLKSLGR
jgi:tetratricopeptide (TPR) repeat protein